MLRLKAKEFCNDPEFKEEEEDMEEEFDTDSDEDES